MFSLIQHGRHATALVNQQQPEPHTNQLHAKAWAKQYAKPNVDNATNPRAHHHFEPVAHATVANVR